MRREGDLGTLVEDFSGKSNPELDSEAIKSFFGVSKITTRREGRENKQVEGVCIILALFSSRLAYSK